MAIATLASLGVHLGWGADPPSGSAAGADAGAEAGTSASSAESAAPPPSLPQSGVMSSFAQSWRGADHDIVIGHFELGAGEKRHRYYCLADARSGKREPNAVLGDPVVQKDGTTAIHLSSVSMYTCADAEHAGLLVTSGYRTNAAVSRAAAAAASAAAAPAAPSPAPAASAPAASGPAASVPAVSSAAPATGSSALVSSVAASHPSGAGSQPVSSIDVGGVRLGMSPEEVRVVLARRWLSNYWEARDNLEGAAAGEHERFVSVISAWSAPATSGGSGESLEVLFTPVPGHERVFAIVHTEAYASDHALRQAVLESLLAEKYGGFARSGPLPAAPTWHWSGAGGVEVGDACEQRGLFGGLREVVTAPNSRANPALSLPVEELEAQTARCGTAIVTEDHLSLNGSAPREERRVLRFTITAYSPAIALEGARSARGAQSARPARAERALEPSVSDL